MKPTQAYSNRNDVVQSGGTTMRAIRLMLAGALVWGGVAVAIVAPPSGASSAVEDVVRPLSAELLSIHARRQPVVHPNAITFNICSHAAPHCVGSGFDKGYLLADQVLNGYPVEPLTVATQEQCLGASATNQTLSYFLLSAGYEMHFINTGPTSCGSTNGIYHGHGNAVYWLGSCAGDCTQEAFYNYTMQVSGELRGWVCGIGAYPAHVGCSTHATWQNGTVALNQVNHYYGVANHFQVYFAPTNASGDFNLQPSLLMGFYANLWTEADVRMLGQVNKPTFRTGIKIDFMFSKQCRRQDSTLLDPTTSDHHIVRGYFGPC